MDEDIRKEKSSQEQKQQETEQREIVVIEQAQAQTQAQEQKIDTLEIINRRNELFQKILQVAIQSTSVSDWIDQNGKPYLQASGAEKIARRFAVKIYDVKIDREDYTDEAGHYYIYTVTGKAAFSGSEEYIEAIGTCTSRDKFFGTVGGKLKKIEDVDVANIKKKAYTNFIMNAITRLLGIRNLTWEDLHKYGITKTGKAQVQYAAAKPQKSSNGGQHDKPFWRSNLEGKEYIFATVGRHFDKSLLEGLAMKQSQKNKNLYYSLYSEQIETALEKEYKFAEMVFEEEKNSAKIENQTKEEI